MQDKPKRYERNDPTVTNCNVIFAEDLNQANNWGRAFWSSGLTTERQLRGIPAAIAPHWYRTTTSRGDWQREGENGESH